MAVDALPQPFVERMRAQLGDDELRDFLASYARPRARGIRVNPDKTTLDEVGALLGLELEPIPWCPHGAYLPADAPPLARHPLALAGLFYLQDPTAMAAAEAVAPEPGWWVCDLAAAPGGKTTHLLSLLGPDGLVVANDVSPNRLGKLHRTLDRWGAANVVTTAFRADRLARMAAGRFDAVLVDAPCSGEAMFVREPKALAGWSPRSVSTLARRQAGIVDDAARLVRPGGILVYSTCTFSPEENEDQIERFLERSPGWELEHAVRLWPHRVRGDGHFVARLRRPGNEPLERDRSRPGTVPPALRDFVDQVGVDAPLERVVARGERLFLAPHQEPGIARTSRPGLPLGTVRSGRFEPAPALATAAAAESRVELPLGDPRLDALLGGLPADDPGDDGWTQICVERWGLAWGRRRRNAVRIPPRSLIRA